MFALLSHLTCVLLLPSLLVVTSYTASSKFFGNQFRGAATMALRNATANMLKGLMPVLARSRNIGTSAPKMKAYTPTLGGEEAQTCVGTVRRKSLKDELLPKNKPLRDYVPVYVAIGMIGLSVTFGLVTAKQELLYAPDVHVKKSRRETLPEVVEPENVVHESEGFVKKSFFRKIAHIKENKDPVVPNPIRGDPLTREARVESLKTVGVDP